MLEKFFGKVFYKALKRALKSIDAETMASNYLAGRAYYASAYAFSKDRKKKLYEDIKTKDFKLKLTFKGIKTIGEALEIFNKLSFQINLSLLPDMPPLYYILITSDLTEVWPTVAKYVATESGLNLESYRPSNDQNGLDIITNAIVTFADGIGNLTIDERLLNNMAEINMQTIANYLSHMRAIVQPKDSYDILNKKFNLDDFIVGNLTSNR